MNGLSERPLGEREVGIAYSAAAVLPLFFSLIFALIALAISPDYETEGWYTLGAYLCSQRLFSVVAGVCAFTRQSPAKALGFCRCHVKFYLIGFVLVFGMLFGASILASLFETWMEELGFTLSGAPVPVDTAGYFAASLVVVGIIPGILEGALFRRRAARRHEALSALGGGSAVRRAVFSLSSEPRADGLSVPVRSCVFALVVIKSGSLLPAVFMHVLNNAFIIVYQYLGAEPGETASLVLLIAGLIAAIGGITCLLLCKTPPREEGNAPVTAYFSCTRRWAFSIAPPCGR